MVARSLLDLKLLFNKIYMYSLALRNKQTSYMYINNEKISCVTHNLNNKKPTGTIRCLLLKENKESRGKMGRIYSRRMVKK